MPRTKATRNFRGSILEKTVVKNGSKATAFDVRVRVPKKDENGNLILNTKGKKTYKDVSGGRKWNKTEANIALINLINRLDVEQRAPASPAQRTFGDLETYYSKEYVKKAVIVGGKKKGRGFKGKISSVTKHVAEMTNYFGRERPLLSITYEDLVTLAENLSLKPTQKGTLPAVSTVNEKLSRLRRMFTVAFQKEWITINPFEKGDKLIDRLAENRRNRMMTFEEEIKIHEMCQPHEIRFVQERKRKDGTVALIRNRRFVDRRHLILYMIASVDTALREGEVFNMEPWQMDFENDVVYLTKEAAEASKTGQAGIIPMSARLKEILLEIKSRTAWHSNMKIFPKMNYSRSFNSAVKEAGIEDLQFRDLRSTGATRMVLAGGATSHVMKITRHRRIKTFLDHYTNVDMKNAQRIGSDLNKFIENETLKVKPQVKKEINELREAA